MLLLGQVSEAVEECLAANLFVVAKEVVLLLSRGEEEKDDSCCCRKDLWLQLARYVLEIDNNNNNNNNSSKAALSLVTESKGVLSIDDLLLLLPDSVEIDLFKVGGVFV